MSALRNRGIATGIAAVAVSALAVGGAITPAQAHDNRGSKSEHSKSDHNTLGSRLYETKTIKIADGTIVAKNTRKGTVSAVDATTITITSADGTSAVYTPAANTELERNDADVTLAAFVIGDIVKVKSFTISAVETVTEIEGKGVVAPVATPSASPSHHEDGDDDHDGIKIEYKGETISSVATYKKLDNTFETVAHYFGIVSAVTETTVSVTSADGATTVYTPGAATITRDRAAATLAQLVVGDHIRISGTLAAAVFTASNVKAVSAAAWAARKCHDSVKDQVVVSQANTIKHERALKVKAAKKAEAKKAAAKKAVAKKAAAKKALKKSLKKNK